MDFEKFASRAHNLNFFWWLHYKPTAHCLLIILSPPWHAFIFLYINLFLLKGKKILLLLTKCRLF